MYILLARNCLKLTISDLVVVFLRGARTDKKVEKEEKTILMTVSTGG